jgi:hypothetical protein
VSHILVLHSLAQIRIHSRRAEGVTYKCRGRGAILSLPRGGLRQEVIHKKLFEDYIRKNVGRWFNWTKERRLPVEYMEDLVLVYGCTLVTSWAAAAFNGNARDAQLSLANRTLDHGGASFVWRNIRGTVDYHDSQLEPNSVCSLLVTFTRRTLTFSQRIIRMHLRIDAFLSSASEQSVCCFGPDTSEARQSLSLMTLITVKKMRYK